MASAHDLNGDLPEGTAEEIAAAAWYRAREAQETADAAKRHGLDAHEQLGTILERLTGLYTAVGAMNEAIGNLSTGLVTQAQVIADNNRKLNIRFDMLEKALNARQALIEAQTAQAQREAEKALKNADDARTSSHDLQDEIEKMDEALKKMHTIDSIRAQKLIDERFGVLVDQKELENLKAEKTARETLQAQMAAERRTNSLTTKGLVISGVIITILGIVGTYFATRAAAPADRGSSTSAPSK